jgi:hypothetical protein
MHYPLQSDEMINGHELQTGITLLCGSQFCISFTCIGNHNFVQIIIKYCQSNAIHLLILSESINMQLFIFLARNINSCILMDSLNINKC